MKFLTLYLLVCFAVALLLACTASCHAPKPIFNLLTPDRVGYGISNSNMTGLGIGNKTMRNQEEPLELDMRGESEGSMIWLEWDFPSWREPSDYDKYMRERIRHLNYRMSMMEAEEENDQLVDVWLKSKPYEQ